MKIKELDFSQYKYMRVCVETCHGPEFFPLGTEDAIKNALGENEIDTEKGVSTDEENVWLTIPTVKTEKKAE